MATVLLVEDDHVVRGAMLRSLTDRGHAVHAVGPSGVPGQLAGPSSGTGATEPQTTSAETQAGPTSGTGSASDASD